MTATKEISFLDYEMSNSAYHGMKGTFSSSNLKLAIEDMELFYKSCVTKELKQNHIPAFDTGTYFHTKVLEPHLLDEECAVYEGVRRGAKWEAFEKANAGKAILIKSQRDTAENLAKLVFDSPRAMELIKGCVPEVSAFADLLIDWGNGEVYTADKENILTLDGWLPLFDEPEISHCTEILRLKVRADALLEDEGAILDLKSTQGNAKSFNAVRKKISSYEYDLSATLYLDIFSIAYGKEFKKFYWTFASKDKHNCKTWLASEKNVKVGRAKWKKAVLLIAEFKSKDWKFEDTVDLLEPEVWQEEWLKEK